jgi:uncharacterized protein YbaR (Trm112 family)
MKLPIRKEMLEILCCPVTKVPVEMLPQDKLEILNKQIKAGGVTDVSGTKIDEILKEALITTDGKTIYRVDEDIPVMLTDSGIHTDQFTGF